jgi:proteasome maturation protein
MMQNIYGTGLAARTQIESQILNRVHRLPGLPSSKLGAEIMSGAVDDFSFESYIGLSADKETAPADVHSVMEAYLGLDKGPNGTKPAGRAIM